VDEAMEAQIDREMRKSPSHKAYTQGDKFASMFAANLFVSLGSYETIQQIAP